MLYDWMDGRRELTDNHDGELNTFLDLVSSASSCERHGDEKFCKWEVGGLEEWSEGSKNGGWISSKLRHVA
jgi:hypothetical protein